MQDQTAGADINNLEKVKELLFGTEIKKNSETIDAVKHDVDLKLKEARNQSNKQMEILKHIIQQQNDGFTASLRSIDEAHRKEVNDLKGQMEKMQNHFRDSLNSLNKRLEDELTSMSDNLRAEIEKVSQDSQRDIGILREIKLSRSMISKMFSEMAEKFAPTK